MTLPTSIGEFRYGELVHAVRVRRRERREDLRD